MPLIRSAPTIRIDFLVAGKAEKVTAVVHELVDIHTRKK
jgi:hypothetical protein